MNTSSVHVKRCQLCKFETPELKFLLKHIRQVHAHRPGFRICCGLSGCPRIFVTFEVFRNHIYCYHTDNDKSSCPSDEDSIGDDNENLSTDEETYVDARKIAAAVWILKIQEVYKIPQHSRSSYRSICWCEIYFDWSWCEPCINANPFAGLENQHMQLKFYTRAFTLIFLIVS